MEHTPEDFCSGIFKCIVGIFKCVMHLPAELKSTETAAIGSLERRASTIV